MISKSKIENIILNCLPYGIVHKKMDIRQTITDFTHFSPVVFNAEGEKMHFFYLQDYVSTHSPYSFISPEYSKTKHIIWDRYNTALQIHFYSHSNIFHSKETAKKKFGILIESEQIVPNDYKRVIEEKGIIKEFAGIFTCSDRILNKYSNAFFAPGGGVWYASSFGGGSMDENAYEKKSKNISLVSSNKTMCELHEYRKNMAYYYKGTNIVDTFGTFNGGRIIPISESLTEYRYSIVIENAISEFYFTEKIMNCFAAMTIPIYVGAKKIGEFFNSDGIIEINPMDFGKLDEILCRCCQEDYMERREAIIDNYNRVQQYRCYEDYIYEHYSDMFE